MGIVGIAARSDCVSHYPSESDEKMSEKMREQLSTLAALQRIDGERTSIEAYLSGVDASIETLSEQLGTFEKQVDEGKERLDELKKQYRQDESDLKSIESAIVKAEEKLHAVKTNKEYQSTLKEIDEFRSKASDTEDRMLSVLDRIDAAEKEVVVLKDDLADMQHEIEDQQSTIRKQAEEKRNTLDELNRKRASVWDELDVKIQKIYERASIQGNGIAVAAVVDGVCQVCRMNLPPQAYIELMRMTGLQMCPACQRLIYPQAMVDDL
jgi:predicted  nucleic acid-binding Zn-ribbon protein